MSVIKEKAITFRKSLIRRIILKPRSLCPNLHLCFQKEWVLVLAPELE